MLLLLALAQSAIAQDSQQKGLEIAQAAKAYDKGFTDFTAQMTMTLKNRSGDTSTRFIRIRTLEVEDDGDKSLSIFDEPADVKGTAMLTYHPRARARRPVALPAGAEAGQAHQFAQQVWSVYGFHLRLRGPGFTGGRESTVTTTCATRLAANGPVT